MWSLGVLIGLPITIVLVLVCVGLMVYFARRSDGGFYEISKKAGVIGSAIALVVVIAGALFFYFPFSKQYHYWSPVSGTVTSVSSRILGDNNSVNQKFVVLINGQEYGCNDTRCSLIKKGDDVTLSCKRTWQFTGTPGWDCNFGSRKPAA